MKRAALLVALCACNEVYGLDPTHLVPDAQPDASPDRPVVPPDGKTTCGALPDFENWKYGPATLPLLEGKPPRTFWFYQRPEGVRALMQELFERRIYDGPLDGEPRILIRPVDPNGTRPEDSVTTPGITPDGTAIWYYERALSRINFATAATSWTPSHRSDLGWPDAASVLPSVPGYYDGTLRMIVLVREVNKPARNYEMQSLDGLEWTPLDTFQTTLDQTLTAYVTLTSDGCFLFYTAAAPGGTTGYRVYVIARSADGVFRDAPIELTALSMAASTFPGVVAPMPRLDEIWTYDSMTNQAIRGTPQ